MKTPLPPPTGGPYRGNGGSEVKRYFAKPLFFSPKSFFLLFLFARARGFSSSARARLFSQEMRCTSEVHFCVGSGPGLGPIRT